MKDYQTDPLTRRIEDALHVRVTRTAPLSVGFGLTGLRLWFNDGRRAAVKAGRARRKDHLLLEAFMLQRLGELSDLPVPEVYMAEEDLLVMSWLGNGGGSITPAVERHAARLLADLHSRPFSYFGFERDTVIGPLPQPNPKTEKWLPFFRDARLVHMAETAHAEGKLPKKLHRGLMKLAERLEDFLGEPDHPSLLHGDLWTGNVIVSGDRIAGFIDPAIYFGHPEIELAFTTMFGTFGRHFFAAYEEIRPLAPGFHELRCDLYNLYPTLVHVRLFGAGYLSGISRTLSRLGF